MPTFEVPEVEAMPRTDGRVFDVDICTDFLLTQLLRHSPGLLHADFRSDEGCWRVLSWSGERFGPDEVIASTPQKGHFRAVLAHLGVRFMEGEIYGGFAEGFIVQRDAPHHFALYMANDQFRGYWLRLYAGAGPPADEPGRGPNAG